MQTIEQQRATHAQDCVARLTSDIRPYKAAVSGLPAMIRMNGLGQALAFIHSRKDQEYRDVYNHVSQWLCRAAPAGVLAGAKDALQALIQRDAATYREAETETLAVLVWIKRYAEAAHLRAAKPETRP